MQKQIIYNTGIYVRLSQEDERAGESLSIENQKRILTKYVNEQGRNIIENTHEPFVSQEIWDKCREVEASVSQGKKTLRDLLLL